MALTRPASPSSCARFLHVASGGARAGWLRQGPDPDVSPSGAVICRWPLSRSRVFCCRRAAANARGGGAGARGRHSRFFLRASSSHRSHRLSRSDSVRLGSARAGRRSGGLRPGRSGRHGGLLPGVVAGAPRLAARPLLIALAVRDGVSGSWRCAVRVLRWPPGTALEGAATGLRFAAAIRPGVPCGPPSPPDRRRGAGRRARVIEVGDRYPGTRSTPPPRTDTVIVRAPRRGDRSVFAISRSHGVFRALDVTVGRGRATGLDIRLPRGLVGRKPMIERRFPDPHRDPLSIESGASMPRDARDWSCGADAGAADSLSACAGQGRACSRPPWRSCGVSPAAAPAAARSRSSWRHPGDLVDERSPLLPPWTPSRRVSPRGSLPSGHGKGGSESRRHAVSDARATSSALLLAFPRARTPSCQRPGACPRSRARRARVIGSAVFSASRPPQRPSRKSHDAFAL